VQESHRVTTEYYKEAIGDVALTGEAAGRQMWYHDPSSPHPADSYTFCAAENPNAADKVSRFVPFAWRWWLVCSRGWGWLQVFRTQQIARWKGPKPDPAFVPKVMKGEPA
jgi:hypothetical protein